MSASSSSSDLRNRIEKLEKFMSGKPLAEQEIIIFLRLLALLFRIIESKFL